MKHTLVFHIISLARKLQRTIGFKLPPFSLSYSQASALLFIDTYKDINQKEIALKLHLEPASVVTLIDELERLKLVKRQSPNGDRRKHHLVLTQQGKIKVRQIRNRTYKLDSLLANQLTTKEFHTLTATVGKLNAYLVSQKGGENEISGTKRSLAA